MGDAPADPAESIVRQSVAAEQERQRSHERARRNGAPDGPAKKRKRRADVDQGDDDLPLNDVGNGRRLVKRHGEDLRYCWPWGKWLVWDGRRWAPDASGEIYRRAKDTVAELAAEAGRRVAELTARLKGATDEAEQDALEAAVDRQRKLISHAFKCQHRGRIEAMVALAKSERGIPVLPQDLDQDQFAFNVGNGTIDLKTGMLREHRRSDMITKLAPVEYRPGTEAPRFHQFLRDVFEDDAGVIGYIRRWCGYSLTGSVREQQLTIFHGTGANGKSTLLDLLLSIMGGDYAIKAANDLLVQKRGESHPTERADLFGKRLVTSIETDDGKRLAEALVKDLTGGDKIRARRMREDFWEFSPTHKLVLATNHKPEIQGTDHAIWRRIQLVPFNVKFEGDRKDKALPEKLAAEREGVLAWMVAGCKEWQSGGLAVPDTVAAAVAEYRAESGTLEAFLSEGCATGNENYKVRASALWEAYREWSGNTAMSQKKMGMTLRAMGFKCSTSDGVWYHGIGLKK